MTLLRASSVDLWERMEAEEVGLREMVCVPTGMIPQEGKVGNAGKLMFAG